MAENLSHRGLKVTIIELADQVMTPLDFEMAEMIHSYLRDKGVALELRNGVDAFSKKGDKISVKTSSGKLITCDFVIMSVGVKPENKLAIDAGLATGKRGGIVVDEFMNTTDPSIYAVGDAAEVNDFITGQRVMLPLAGPANKQGRIAADNACGRQSSFKGTIGTSVAKVFDLVVASTGQSEKLLKNQGLAYCKSYTSSGSHASYYPGAESMNIKLLFSKSDGLVLGAQIIGGRGVDKRIDVIATAIKGRLTVYDLEELELAYAPPFSSAKDPVNVAGFVAGNILKGDVEAIYPEDLATLDPEENILLDLRSQEEIEESGNIENSLCILLNELRYRLNELDKTKTYILYCAIGLRGYIAFRILHQHGFKAKNLSGGFLFYKYALPKLEKKLENEFV
jgi:rhodanese-related sulfurtransferase